MWTLVAFAILFPVAGGISHSLQAKTFYIYKEPKQTWNDARAICEDTGAHLVTVNNKATVEALRAYSENEANNWKDIMKNDFWIGLNKETSSTDDYRWADCEPFGGSTAFSAWKETEPQNTVDYHCVVEERDTLQWRSRQCAETKQFMCEKDIGACTYTAGVGTCTTADFHANMNVPTITECQEQCSTQVSDNLACWMYTYESGQCTLYFDGDPEKCSASFQVSAQGTDGLRSCFKFELKETPTLQSSDSSNLPNVNCDLYTTLTPSTMTATTTSTTTTPTTTTIQTTSATATNTETTAPTTTNTQRAAATTTNTQTTAGTTTNTQTTAATTINTQTTAATTIDTQSATAKTTNTQTTAATTIDTQPATAKTTNTQTTAATTIDTQPATAKTTNTQTTAATTIDTQPATAKTTNTQTTAATTINTQPATATTTNTQTTTTTTSATSRADMTLQPNDTCPCYTCVSAKSQEEIQKLVKFLISWLTIDKATLSATRRKRESAEDGRPSATTIGFSGGMFLLIFFGLLVLSDLVRFFKYIDEWKSRRRIIRNE